MLHRCRTGDAGHLSDGGGELIYGAASTRVVYHLDLSRAFFDQGTLNGISLSLFIGILQLVDALLDFCDADALFPRVPVDRVKRTKNGEQIRILILQSLERIH